MKKQLSVALLTRGSLDRQLLARLPALGDNLALVIASSLRHASRIANSLRAGFPAACLAEAGACRVLLIVADERNALRILAELAVARFDWSRKAVILVAGNLGTEDLREFQERGASVASLGSAGPAIDRLVVEGDDEAVRLAGDLIVGRGVRMLRILPARKHLYTAGVSFVTSLLAPQAHAAVECLRAAGVSLREALGIIEVSADQALRAYSKAGKKGWSGPLAAEGRRGAMRQTQALRQLDAQLAGYFRSNAEHALSVFRQTGKVGTSATAAD